MKFTMLALWVALVANGSTVFAQSTSGSIYGQTSPGADVTVVIKSQDTGLTRELPVDASGKFSFSSLPTGTYTVTLQKGGQDVSAQNARVNAGIGTVITFELEEVVVTGTAASPIDTTTAQVSTTFSAAQLNYLPVGTDLVSVALLAPGTSRGATAVDNSPYNSLASFGGASVAENSYYINGFNVTNLFRNLEYSQLPFYAISSEQVITGGYGPEYGLSTGGVVSVVSKKGTNEWNIGGSVTWSPNSLRATSGPRTYTSDGLAYRDYSQDTDTTTLYDLWVGGAIVPDKLFVYAIGEFSKENALLYPNSYYQDRNVWDRETKKPFGLVKLDWNINDKNILEFTGIQDSRKNSYANYSDDTDANGFVVKGDYVGTDVIKRGGQIGILKYTGYVTNDFTVAAQYGELTSKREEYEYAPDGTLISYDGTVGNYNQPGCPYVVYQPSWQSANSSADTPTCYVSSSIATSAGKDKRKAGRVDLEYKVPGAFLGSHTLKAGYEKDKWTSFYGESYQGGTYYQYNNGGTAYASTPYEVAVTGNYVRVRHFQTGANAGVNTDGYYLKDDWQLTKDFLVQLGVRNDSFKNLNGAGQAYVTQDDIWQPRLGFAWDMTGNSINKLYGSYGIYSLPVTAGVAVRGASASIYSYQYFRYTSIDPATGAATLGAPLGPVLYYNGEDGTTPAAGTFAATNLDPTTQEEFILGYQHDLGSGWKAGIRGTYRNLKKTIDDMCDSRPFDRWAARNGGFDTSNIDNNVPCFVINPGYGADLSYDLDGDGTLEHVHLTPEDIALPKAKRRYIGIELSLEKAWNEEWYAQASYTWAHNYGNGEGLADSDNGQLDIGTTLAFDFPELMVGAYGNLPNDHRHTLKILGAYRPFAEWTLSSNLLLQSGKPKNCIGVGPNDWGGYGANYFYCNDQLAPRGSAGTTDTLFNIDLAVTYSPSFAPGLALMASVYNIFNSHAVTSIDEYYEDDSKSALTSYKSAYSYQSPRYVQLAVKYNFGFSGK